MASERYPMNKPEGAIWVRAFLEEHPDFLDFSNLEENADVREWIPRLKSDRERTLREWLGNAIRCGQDYSLAHCPHTTRELWGAFFGGIMMGIPITSLLVLAIRSL